MLLRAFLDGDFETAYASAQALAEAYHEALLEAARARFQANFGTAICKHCTGLHAGPGVVATCFQVEKCNYTNIQAGSEGPRQQKIIRNLIKDLG